MDPVKIIESFYTAGTPQCRMLLKHSMQVRDKALEILNHSPVPLNTALVSDGAMLHDIGIFLCHAPDILCTGKEHYIRHGILGAELLRSLGADMEPYARICERHTGSGLAAEEIRRARLPLPERDFLPETPEEILICLADKFYSKSGDMQEKSFERVCRSMSKFGEDSLNRFLAMSRMFGLV